MHSHSVDASWKIATLDGCDGTLHARKARLERAGRACQRYCAIGASAHELGRLALHAWLLPRKPYAENKSGRQLEMGATCATVMNRLRASPSCAAKASRMCIRTKSMRTCMHGSTHSSKAFFVLKQDVCRREQRDHRRAVFFPEPRDFETLSVHFDQAATPCLFCLPQ